MQDHVAGLIRNALDTFDAPGQSVTALVRQAARIASLRRDYEFQYRFQFDLLDVKSGAAKTDPNIKNINNNLTTLLGVQGAREQATSAYNAYQSARSTGTNGSINVHSVAQLETLLDQLRRIYGDYSVEGKRSSSYSIGATRAAGREQAKLLPVIQQTVEILERIRQAVHSYLVLAEASLNSGTPSSSVFERGLSYVRSALAERAPAALDKFTAAEERLASGSPEDLSQALSSTRRMIKDLADALYPATGETIVGDDRVQRVMDEDAYRNRLIQFAKERLGRHLQGRVLNDTLASYGKRIINLDSMASKGVHGEVSAAEAEQCVIWAFMLAADLLRIDDGSAAELAGSDQHAG